MGPNTSKARNSYNHAHLRSLSHIFIPRRVVYYTPSDFFKTVLSVNRCNKIYFFKPRPQVWLLDFIHRIRLELILYYLTVNYMYILISFSYLLFLHAEGYRLNLNVDTWIERTPKFCKLTSV